MLPILHSLLFIFLYIILIIITYFRYSIVRPTAFFKSVSGQLELLQQGWPFVMFGDGQICKYVNAY